MADFKIAGAYVEFGEKGYDKLKSDISGLRGALEALKRNLSFGNIMGGVGGGILAASGIKSAFSTALSFVTAIPKAMVSGAAEMETYTEQWRTLLGDMGKAEGMMGRLAKFADVTPFELPEVVRASKLMQVFGGDVLNTEERLTAIGDAASATGSSFEEVAFWVSRAYSLMKSGQPFGEAALRLQEMGIMSGKARQEIEYLSKVFPGSDKPFGMLMDSLKPFGGAMERQSKTLAGLWSTIKDSAQRAATEVGQRFAPAIKNAESKTITFFQRLSGNKNLWDGTAKNLSNAFERALDTITPERIDLATKWIAGLPAAIERALRDGGVAGAVRDFGQAIGQAAAQGLRDAIVPNFPLPNFVNPQGGRIPGIHGRPMSDLPNLRNMTPEQLAEEMQRRRNAIAQGFAPAQAPASAPAPAAPNAAQQQRDAIARALANDPELARRRAAAARAEEIARNAEGAFGSASPFARSRSALAIEASDAVRAREDAIRRQVRRQLAGPQAAGADPNALPAGDRLDIVSSAARRRLAVLRGQWNEAPRFMGLQEMWKSIAQGAASPKTDLASIMREMVDEQKAEKRLMERAHELMERFVRTGIVRFAN